MRGGASLSLVAKLGVCVWMEGGVVMNVSAACKLPCDVNARS